MNRTIEVLITQPFGEDLVQKLSNVSPRVKITVLKARKVDDVPDEVWANTEVLYTSRILPKPEQAPRLRWIQFHWAGVDHAIETPILHKPDVVATNLSGAASSQMAEYAITLLLAMGHHIPRLCAMHRQGEWPNDRWERFSPVELRNSTVGIVGYGSIGRQIARLLQSFGASVLAAKRDARHPEDTGYTPDGLGDPTGDLIQRLYPIQALRSMLKECDFVVVCVPLTPETRGLISVKEFAAMKPTAFIVDLSRGGVIDQDALVTALRENRLAGAALDVFTQEPLPPDNPLWKLSNVLLSPHVAGFSPNYDDRAVALFSENLLRYVSGLELYNQISMERGY